VGEHLLQHIQQGGVVVGSEARPASSRQRIGSRVPSSRRGIYLIEASV
jgi:hypothetical protein